MADDVLLNIHLCIHNTTEQAPTQHRFLYTLIACSLAFFMFSFQVHEKTILLPALPVALVTHREGLVAVWFQLIAAFSMAPLLYKDGQTPQYAACCLIYLGAAVLYPAVPLAVHSWWMKVVCHLRLAIGTHLHRVHFLARLSCMRRVTMLVCSCLAYCTTVFI